MTSDAGPVEIAVVCDAQNRVSTVLQDSAACPVASSRAFTELFDAGSNAKALALLATIRERGAAFDWELSVRAARGIRLLHFSGAPAADGVLVVGAESRSSAIALLTQRLLGLGIDVPPHAPSQETLELYEELARLNNQLVDAQRELERTHAELRRVGQERSKLAAMAAHDLRTPLGVVQLSASALQKMLDLAPDSNADRLLTMIASNAGRMATLVNDLLSAFTHDLPTVHLEEAPVDIEHLVRANVRANTLIAQQKEIGIRVDVSGPRLTIEADPTRLQQVFDNLIHNAIKFSPRGSRIDVSLVSSPTEVVIAVEDHGTGMDARRLDAVLAGHATSGWGTEREGGFGLGLTISKAIVEKHGGSFNVRSAPRSGSRFEIRLPVGRSGNARLPN